MRCAGGLAWLAVIGALGIGLIDPRHGEAQVRTLSGTLRSSASFDEQRVGETTTQRSELRHDYSLGVRGLILDPRLATFEVTGALGGNTPLLGQGEQAQVLTGGLNLHFLPFSRIPLSLRHFQSHGWDGSTSDVMTSGLTWQVNHPLYPSLSLNVERTAVHIAGRSPSDTSFLSGTLQSNYHLEKINLFGEVGARRTEDSLRQTSTMSQFANFSGAYNPSPATNVQGAANYFQEGERLSAGVNASLINRPDPTLTRSANASIRTTRSGDSSTHSLDAGGSLTKNYRLAPTLQTFLTGGATFAADVASQPPTSGAGGAAQGSGQGFMSLTATGGAGVTYSGIRYLVATADSTLAALYEDEHEQGVGVRGTFHLGLTGQNLGPVTAGGDYTVRAEMGVVNSVDHTVSLRGTVVYPIRPTLTLEAFTQSGMFVREGGAAGASPGATVGLAGGGRATYTGIPFVNWNLVSQYQLAKSGQFQTQSITTSTILTYTPMAKFQATLTGRREDILTTGEIRHSVQADASYRLGATLFTLTYSIDMLSGRGVSTMLQRAMLTWTRPFGRRFR